MDCVISIINVYLLLSFQLIIKDRNIIKNAVNEHTKNQNLTFKKQFYFALLTLAFCPILKLISMYCLLKDKEKK